MAMPDHLCKLVDLPAELLTLIVEELWWASFYHPLVEEQLTDVRAVRLTCRRLETIAKPLLYREVTTTTKSMLTRFMKHMVNREESQTLVEAFMTMNINSVDAHVPCSALHTFTNLRHLSLNSGVGEDLLDTLPMRFDLFPRLLSFSLFNHWCHASGSIQIEFLKLLPLLATRSLRRFSLSGYEASTQDFVAWPLLPCDLPDLLEVSIQNSNRVSGIGEALRALRGISSLAIKGCRGRDISLQHELIEDLAPGLKELDFLDDPRSGDYPVDYDLRHLRKLERLGIREMTLAWLRLDNRSQEYAPDDPKPRLLLKFPLQLKHLVIEVFPETVHRPTCYRVLVDMMEQHAPLFPHLSRLEVSCYHFEFSATTADYHPDTHHPNGSWARNWNHNRIAPAENGFIDTEEGDKTAECMKLRAVCEIKRVRLVLRNLVCAP